MAAPSNASVSLSKTGMLRAEDGLQEVITQLNHAVGALRAIANKLDADGGVTDTNYFSVILDAAGSNPAKQITAKIGL